LSILFQEVLEHIGRLVKILSDSSAFLVHAREMELGLRVILFHAKIEKPYCLCITLSNSTTFLND
jgi:hypothetical protein